MVVIWLEFGLGCYLIVVFWVGLLIVLVIGWFVDWFGCCLLVDVVCFTGCCVWCFGWLFVFG